MKESMKKQIQKAQNGNEKVMNEIINNNTGLIWNIIKRFKGRGYDTEDLYQIGMIGLIKCIKKFDINYNVEFSTYAVPYILGEIKRFIRDDGMIKVSRSIKELSYKINELQKAYRDYKNEEIGIETISRDLNVSKEEIIIAMESVKQVESFEKKVYTNDDDGISIIETLKEENQEEKMIDNIILGELISELGEREKQIIVLRYYRGKTQTEIAKILGITQVQVSRIERKILTSMKRKLIC